MVGKDRAVVHEEIEQVGNLLEIGRDELIVATEMHVIELDVNDMLDARRQVTD